MGKLLCPSGVTGEGGLEWGQGDHMPRFACVRPGTYLCPRVTGNSATLTLRIFSCLGNSTTVSAEMGTCREMGRD